MFQGAIFIKWSFNKFIYDEMPVSERMEHMDKLTFDANPRVEFWTAVVDILTALFIFWYFINFTIFTSITVKLINLLVIK